MGLLIRIVSVFCAKTRTLVRQNRRAAIKIRLEIIVFGNDP